MPNLERKPLSFNAWCTYEQANNAGVYLPPGYTWVIEHDRGEAHLNLQNRDLSERTKFAPPKRAANELNNLIFQ